MLEKHSKYVLPHLILWTVLIFAILHHSQVESHSIIPALPKTSRILDSSRPLISDDIMFDESFKNGIRGYGEQNSYLDHSSSDSDVTTKDVANLQKTENSNNNNNITTRRSRSRPSNSKNNPKHYHVDGPLPTISDSLFSLIVLVYVSVIFIFMFFAFCWQDPSLDQAKEDSEQKASITKKNSMIADSTPSNNRAGHPPNVNSSFNNNGCSKMSATHQPIMTRILREEQIQMERIERELIAKERKEDEERKTLKQEDQTGQSNNSTDNHTNSNFNNDETKLRPGAFETSDKTKNLQPHIDHHNNIESDEKKPEKSQGFVVVKAASRHHHHPPSLLIQFSEERMDEEDDDELVDIEDGKLAGSSQHNRKVNDPHHVRGECDRKKNHGDCSRTLVRHDDTKCTSFETTTTVDCIELTETCLRVIDQ